MSQPVPEDDFDEAWYLRANPDIAAAVAGGHFSSGREHFQRHGRAEGRPGIPPGKRASAMPEGWDKAWYLSTYPDVAMAVRDGAVGSGYEHWDRSGRAEARTAPPGYVERDRFDADWYVASYHVAADEIRAGRARDAQDHYRTLGRARGYLPNRLAPRPDDPAGIPSRFGGLWLDHGNALDLIEGRRELGRITGAQAALLRDWVRDGYVILRGAVPSELADRAAEELRRAYAGEIPELRFECHAVGGYRPVPWDPLVLQEPAKALDLHWWSPAVRELIFAPAVREFLELLFERRALASQTLTFLRGSAQDYHQDTVYVPFSLPTQFAASWIALEDVTEGGGELTYLDGSHKLPEQLYAGRFKTLWDAQRMLRDNALRDEMKDYSARLEQRGREHGMAPSRFMAKKGDALVWHADLAHGGLPISQGATRKSVVTHYCPKEVAALAFERGATEVRSYEGVASYATGYYAGR